MKDLFVVEVYHPEIETGLITYPAICENLIARNDHLIRSTPYIYDATWHSKEEADAICKKMNDIYFSDEDSNGGFKTYHFKPVKIPFLKWLITKKMHDRIECKRREADEMYMKVCRGDFQ